MTLTQLRYFCDVAETKNFTASSKKLFVAQSSISFAIRELETELGVPLFFRGKTTELTSYGKKLLPFIQASLNSLDSGIEERENSKGAAESVRIGVFVNTTHYLIPWFLKNFADTYANSCIKLDFAVQYSAWTDMFEPMTRGEYDLIITGCEEPQPNCESVQIAIQPMKLLVHNEDARFSGMSAVKFRDLEGMNVVCVHKNSYMDRYFKRMCKSAGIEIPNMTYAQDMASMIASVILKQGIGLTTSFPLENSHLRLIGIDEPDAVRRIFLSWPTNRELSGSAAIVRDYFIQVSKSHSMDVLSF